MKNKKWFLLFVPVVMMLVNLACGFNVSTANIKDAKLALDNEGTQTKASFTSKDTTIYCNVDLANAPSDTKVKAVWTAVNVQGADPNTQIAQTELTSGDGVLHFKLSNNTAWPTGSYKVDLYLNDKLNRTIDFKVE